MTRWVLRLRGQRGATAVEYAIMAAFIAAVIVAGVTVLGHQVSALFNEAAIRV